MAESELNVKININGNGASAVGALSRVKSALHGIQNVAAGVTRALGWIHLAVNGVNMLVNAFKWLKDKIGETARELANFKWNVEMRSAANVSALVSSQKDPSEIRRDLRAYLSQVGYDAGDNRGTIKDLMTKQRLDVMMKTNADQAKGYVSHLRATTAGAILAFPGYELIRVQERHLKRDWHNRWRNAASKVGWEGVAKGTDRMVALKTSPIWVAISAFGNPFPPFDFNSGMGLKDVKKSECRALGLLGENEQPEIPQVPDFNQKLSASVPMHDNSLCADILRDRFGDQVDFRGNEVHWRGELIREVLEGKVKKVSLGTGFNGEKTSLSHSLFDTHTVKHFGDNEKRHDAIPMTAADYELVPTLWRNPDRVKDGMYGRKLLELDMIDGGTLVGAWDRLTGFRTFYKMKNPKGA